jgi:hypothetical protein
LAQIEQYDVSVTGNALNFKPKQQLTEPYVLRYQAPSGSSMLIANFLTMRFSRNLSVSRGVKVTVISLNQRTGKVETATAQRSRVKNATIAGIGKNGLPTAEYTYIYPNMDKNQAQAQADSLVGDISQHEVNLNADLPGDDLLMPQTPVQVIGTNTSFDQIYWPASIQRRYSISDGYRMTLRARNFSPETQLS